VPTDANLLEDYRSFGQLLHACERVMEEVNGNVHRLTGQAPEGIHRRSGRSRVGSCLQPSARGRCCDGYSMIRSHSSAAERATNAISGSSPMLNTSCGTSGLM
jgi:hypothetical protein